MYTGRVLKTFVDRFNPARGAYQPGDIFASDDLGRMTDLAARGYIHFEAPRVQQELDSTKGGRQKRRAAETDEAADQEGSESEG